MTVLLEIKDSKAKALLEVLNGLPYVKTTSLNNKKSKLKVELIDAIKELNLIKQGKAKGIPIQKLLDEL